MTGRVFSSFTCLPGSGSASTSGYSFNKESIFSAGLITRESLSWIRMTRTARQDTRLSGKEDAGHSLFLGGCLFGFYGENNSKNRNGSCRDVT